MAEAKEEERAAPPAESKISEEELAAVEELAAAHKWVLGDVFTKQELAQHGTRADDGRLCGPPAEPVLRVLRPTATGGS